MIIVFNNLLFRAEIKACLGSCFFAFAKDVPGPRATVAGLSIESKRQITLTMFDGLSLLCLRLWSFLVRLCRGYLSISLGTLLLRPWGDCR